VFAGDAAAPQLIARSGNAAPGVGAGVVYGGFVGPVINDAGQITYRASLSGTGVTSSNDLTIYAGTLSSPQLIARENSQAPGAPVGVLYSSFSTPALNDAGDIAYMASLRGSVTTVSDAAIYAGASAGPQLVAREADQAHGLAAGVVYASFKSNPGLNDAGHVSYTATLSGTSVASDNDEAIFIGPFNAPQPIARKGDAVAGSLSIRLGTFTFETPALNNVGQVAYTAAVAGDGIDASNDGGLFAFDPVLGNVLIAREGSAFAVGGGLGDVRTIADGGIAFFAGRSDDVITGLSNDGTMAFRLLFTDGTSGIFTALVRLPGDVDGDRRVNFDDLLVLARSYNKPGTYRSGDFTGDGVINFDDLLILARNYGRGGPAGLAELGATAGFEADWALAQSLVPEPVALPAGIALVMALRRGRRS
jgi:hypothetical protein